ncbi:hypothetical protein BH24ACT5_BH24ACT5_31350 [soil metagenome]
MGVDWDGPVLRQSERFDAYEAALDHLTAAGLTYECFCSRREVREAAAAPHGSGERIYPGTCRNLTESARARRRAERPPALRFRAAGDVIAFEDLIAARFAAPTHDIVLRRNDGVPAYNLAVVVDDAAQGVDEVVRADDLLGSTPSQIAVQRALGLATPSYAHVPLVVGDTGVRLAKRDGAITLADLQESGWTPAAVRRALAASLGLKSTAELMTPTELIDRVDLARFVARGRDPVPLTAILRPSGADRHEAATRRATIGRV